MRRPHYFWATCLFPVLILAGTAERAAGRESPRSIEAPPNSPGPAWPRLLPGVESRYISSFDRAGRNADGFYSRHSVLYTRPDGQHVIFDALGPGVLNTLWFTGPQEGGEGLDLGRIRFYWDGDERPRLETVVQQLFGGRQAPFTRPMVASNRESTGGFVSWVPLPYRRQLVITTERRPSFVIAQYDTYPVDTQINSWTPRQRMAPVLWRGLFAAAARGLSTGALHDVPLDFHHRGAGTIEAIRLAPAPESRSPEQLRRARIQIFWDGGTTPGVDAPVDMFFGSGLGEAEVRAVAFTMQDGIYENRFPMPFWEGFRIRVLGLQGKLQLRVGPPRYPRESTGTLHARFAEARPTRPGQDFEWLYLRGAGKLVGTVLAIRPPGPHVKRWWEGDLRSYADGRRTPGLHGTGLEDDHLGGWSNTFFCHPFSLPLHGEPRAELIERRGVQYNARVTLYRLWPGINFGASLRHSVEHGSENRVSGHYAGLAFYYAHPGGPRLQETDRLDLGDARSRERHGFSVQGVAELSALSGAFEGRGYKEMITDVALAHRGAAQLTLAALPDNRGCWLRRMYDQARPRQRARLEVDGQPLGDWYVAEGNARLRWAERDLFLPPFVTRGRTRLRITVVPSAASPPWNAAEYRLLCEPAR